MHITILDGILIIFTLISAVLAMIRGLSREVFSIASWTSGAGAAYLFHEPITPYLEHYIKNQQIAMMVACALIFLLTLVVLTVLTMKIADFIVDSCIGALDRTLGFIYGAARGVLVIAIALFFFTWLSGGNQPAWVSEAKSKPLLEAIIAQLQKFLPQIHESTIFEKIMPLENELDKLKTIQTENKEQTETKIPENQDKPSKNDSKKEQKL